MVIRSSQIDALKRDRFNCYVKKLVDLLRTRYSDTIVQLTAGSRPVARLPEALLDRLIHASVEKGLQYHLSSESDIATFVLWKFVVAPNFDRHPRCQEVLRDSSAEGRIDHLRRVMSDDDWEIARARYDSDAWGEHDLGMEAKS
jgi:hypothetical protein